jgi:hypothetical protein
MGMLFPMMASSAISAGGSLLGGLLGGGGGQQQYQPQNWQIAMGILGPLLGAGVQQYQADQTNAATKKFVADQTGNWGEVAKGLGGYYNQTGNAGMNFLQQLWGGGQQNQMGMMNSLLYGTPYSPTGTPNANSLASAMSIPGTGVDVMGQSSPAYSALSGGVPSGASNLPQALQGYAGRYSSGMGMLEGMGTQSRKDINRQYDAKQSEAASNAVARGLAGTSVPGAMVAGLERERSGALGTLDESLRNDQLSWSSLLSGDFLNAQNAAYTNMQNYDTSMGANALNMFNQGVGQRIGSAMDITGQIAALQNLLIPQGPGQPNWGDVFGTVGNNMTSLYQPGVGSAGVNPYAAALPGIGSNFGNAFLLSQLFGGGGVPSGTAATANNMASSIMPSPFAFM